MSAPRLYAKHVTLSRCLVYAGFFLLLLLLFLISKIGFGVRNWHELSIASTFRHIEEMRNVRDKNECDSQPFQSHLSIQKAYHIQLFGCPTSGLHFRFVLYRIVAFILVSSSNIVWSIEMYSQCECLKYSRFREIYLNGKRCFVSRSLISRTQVLHFQTFQSYPIDEIVSFDARFFRYDIDGIHQLSWNITIINEVIKKIVVPRQRIIEYLIQKLN